MQVTCGRGKIDGDSEVGVSGEEGPQRVELGSEGRLERVVSGSL